MAKLSRFTAAIATLCLAGALSACQGKDSPRAADESNQKMSQGSVSTHRSTTQGAFASSDFAAQNVPSPEDEAGKINFNDYKAGISAVIFNDEKEFSENDMAIIDAYSHCIAAKTYASVSKDYAALIATQDRERLASVEPTDADSTVFDTARDECLSMDEGR